MVSKVLVFDRFWENDSGKTNPGFCIRVTRMGVLHMHLGRGMGTRASMDEKVRFFTFEDEEGFPLSFSVVFLIPNYMAIAQRQWSLAGLLPCSQNVLSQN